MKFTKWEAEELAYKLSVLMDEEEYLESINKTEDDFATLIAKVKTGGEFEEWEIKELSEEAENLLDIAEANSSAGFPEYDKDVRKLKKLVKKFEPAPAVLQGE